jgi:hypothetical protein
LICFLEETFSAALVLLLCLSFFRAVICCHFIF